MLDGLRVLDMSWLGPGSITTWLLADLGAEVIKLEPPDGSDHVRAFPPFDAGVGVAHLALHRNKKSLAVDVRDPAGAQAVRAIAESADAVVDGMRPGVADRLGLGYAQLSAANPRVVYCALSGFGAGGPLSNTAAHDLNYVARSGMLSLLPSDKLHPPPVQAADFLGAALGAFAVCAGMLQAKSIGRGTLVETSLFDAAVYGVGLLHAQALLGIEHAPGAHFLVGGLAAYGIYECADGAYLTVGALEPKFWRSLCAALDLPEEAEGDHWAPARQPMLKKRLAERFRSRTRADWLEVLAGHDTCVQPVLGFGEAVRDAHQLSRRRVQQVRHPAHGGLVDVPASPVVVGDRVPEIATLPAVGEDTRALLAGAGYTAEAIDELVAAGVAAVAATTDPGE